MFQNMYYGSFLSFSWAPESDFSVWSSIQMYYCFIQSGYLVKVGQNIGVGYHLAGRGYLNKNIFFSVITKARDTK